LAEAGVEIALQFLCQLKNYPLAAKSQVLRKDSSHPLLEQSPYTKRQNLKSRLSGRDCNIACEIRQAPRFKFLGIRKTLPPRIQTTKVLSLASNVSLEHWMSRCIWCIKN